MKPRFFREFKLFRLINAKSHRAPKSATGVFLKSRGANLHKFYKINARAIRRVRSSPRLGRFSNFQAKKAKVFTTRLDVGRFSKTSLRQTSRLGKSMNLRRFDAEGKNNNYRAKRPTITRFKPEGKQPTINNERFEASRFSKGENRVSYHPFQLRMERFPTIDKIAPLKRTTKAANIKRFNFEGMGSESSRRMPSITRPSRFSFQGLKIAPKISAKSNKPARYTENAVRPGIRHAYAPKRKLKIPYVKILLVFVILLLLAGIGYIAYILINNDSTLGFLR